MAAVRNFQPEPPLTVVMARVAELFGKPPSYFLDTDGQAAA